MRKLGNKITQKGIGKKVKKSPNELLSELSTKRSQGISKKEKSQLTKKELAIRLGISDRTLRSYKRYFASLDNPNISFNKNDRRPSKELLKKISAIATKKKIKKTRLSGSKYDKAQVENLKSVVSSGTFKQLQKEFDKPTFDGLLIRVNILFITKEGSFSDWPTFRISNKYNQRELKSLRALNNFIIGELQKIIRNKDSILGFEIVQIVFDVTTTEFEPNIPKSKAPNKKGKTPFKGGEKLPPKK